MVLSKLRRRLGKSAEPKTSKTSKPIPSTSALADPLADRILANASDDAGAKPAQTTAIPADNAELLAAVKARIDQARSVGMDEQACLDRITFHGPATQADVLECLRTFGLAIFPSIYGADRLAAIQKEYEELMDTGAELARGVAAREDTPANSYAMDLKRSDIAADRFPETAALFGSPSVEEIAKTFFAGQSFDYNGDIFVQWTDHTDVPASGPLHWDKQLTLKSWLYVTDATEGYGAMRAGVGTAAWTRYIREDAMFDGVPYGQIVNQMEEKGFPVVSTGGPAGTFFLFVTDTAHGATPVAPGKRRNIMRARSRPHRVHQWSAWANKL